MEKKLLLGYEFFQRVMGNPNYRLHMSSSKRKTVDKWFILIKDHYRENYISLGDNFLWEYLIFQSNRYIDSEVQAESFSWIFGKKAVERWISRHEAWRWASAQCFGTCRYNIYEHEFYDFLNEVKVPDSQKKLSEYYESIRKKQEIGLCAIQTPLFNVLSISCIRCPSKADCKKIKKHKEKNG